MRIRCRRCASQRLELDRSRHILSLNAGLSQQEWMRDVATGSKCSRCAFQRPNENVELRDNPISGNDLKIVILCDSAIRVTADQRQIVIHCPGISDMLCRFGHG
jgi:hypothetical protein